SRNPDAAIQWPLRRSGVILPGGYEALWLVSPLSNLPLWLAEQHDHNKESRRGDRRCPGRGARRAHARGLEGLDTTKGFVAKCMKPLALPSGIEPLSPP